MGSLRWSAYICVLIRDIRSFLNQEDAPQSRYSPCQSRESPFPQRLAATRRSDTQHHAYARFRPSPAREMRIGADPEAVHERMQLVSYADDMQGMEGVGEG